MTYEESAALMTDVPFWGKVKVSCMKYATYINNEPPSTEGHSARYRWAQMAMRDPDSTARQMQASVVMDPSIQAEGAASSDAAIQSATEAVVNRFL